MDFCITEKDDGSLIRDFLRRHLSLSSKMLKFLKYRPDGILLNGERKTVRAVLHTGDLLALATEDSESSEAAVPVDLPLEVLYEDDDVCVPNKPADMPTHPSHDHYRDTVANALAFRYQSAKIPFVFRPVNRLDRNTSGLLLIARNKMAAGKMNLFLAQGKIEKRYLAVLDGLLPQDEGLIDACLHRTEKSIIVREVCSPDAPDASPSQTRYRVLARENGHTLVSVQPLTGRTHQIRVHFASIGFPLTGDDLYGIASPLIGRHALHAVSLSFPLPSEERTVRLFAPFPQDFQALVSGLFPDFSFTRFSDFLKEKGSDIDA